MSTSKRERLIGRLSDGVYRRAFLSEHIQKSLPFQIRSMREQRGWTQKELGQRCGKTQEWICKLENPNYGRFSIQTLLDIAGGFDVAVTARFVSYGDLLDWYTNRSGAAIPSFGDDPAINVDASREVSRVAVAESVDVSIGRSGAVVEATFGTNDRQFADVA